MLAHYSAVVQPRTNTHWRSHNADNIEFAREVEQLQNLHFCLLNKRLLCKEVLTSVARD